MIGASKPNKTDVLKIKKLARDGLNDCEIARQFIPESNEPVTREHIRAIRIGKRWNQVNHSFLMKEDLSDLPHLRTHINGVQIETQVGWLKTKTLEKWFFLTLVDDIEVDGPLDQLMDFKPSTREILQFHHQFVSMYL